MENAKADKDPNQDASLRRLVALYPACFHLSEHERRPLRVGISRDLEAADTGTALVQLRQALGWYCGSIGYLQNMVAELTGSVSMGYLVASSRKLRRPMQRSGFLLRAAKKARQKAAKPGRRRVLRRWAGRGMA